MRAFIWAQLLAISFAPAAHGQAAPVAASPARVSDAEALAGLDEAMERLVREWKVPGFAVSVVREGRMVMARGYGVRSPRTQAPMTPNTLFPIASMTKPFTSFAIGLLVDEGKLAFDTPVIRYIPELRLSDPRVTDELTLRDMLSHRSGLPRHDFVGWNRSLTRKQLPGLFEKLEFSQPMRASFQYNNLMYALSGLAIERASGVEWERFVEDRILTPLKMERTTPIYARAIADPDRMEGIESVHGVDQVVPLYRDPKVLVPVGGMYSSVHDLANWMILHLDGGRFEGRQLISPDTLTELHSSSISRGATMRDPERVPLGYGMAWFSDIYRGRPIVHHGGNLPGTSTMAALIPSERLGVAVLVNQGSSELRDLVTWMIFDRFLGGTGRDWSGEALQRRASATGEPPASTTLEPAEQPAPPTHPLAAFAGSYAHPGYGRIEVRLDQGRLAIRRDSDEAPLKHVHYNVFDADTADVANAFLDTRLQFTMDAFGRIAAIESHLEPSVAPIRFERQASAQLSQAPYLASLTGNYRLGPNRLKISVLGNSLVWTVVGGTPDRLLPGLGDEFMLARRRDARIAFVHDTGGRVTALRMTDAAGTVEARRID